MLAEALGVGGRLSGPFADIASSAGPGAAAIEQLLGRDRGREVGASKVGYREDRVCVMTRDRRICISIVRAQLLMYSWCVCVCVRACAFSLRCSFPVTLL